MQKQLENKCEEIESRERRNNLRIYSVPEKCEGNNMMDFVENVIREKLDCTELRTDDTIRTAVKRKLDNRILAIVSRELVAAEGHYHRSCYRLYTKDAAPVAASSAPDGEDIDETNDDGVQYDAAEKQSYSELFSFIREELFLNPAVVPLIDFTARLVSRMNGLGIAKQSTKKHICRKLESEFGEALHIIQNDKGKVLLYPDNLSLSKLAKAHQALQAELQVMRSAKTEDTISKAALRMRDDVKKHLMQYCS
ncbi:hypothetical protein KUCAC02_018788 [Chaenocephalus aceratus]|uniref:Uncharacterized protein n=1 Tax=Chaenocephalus aceratus TaxID=36190 RepID=A0ACB9WAF5_CHAAC|nr:hypothetical protein KUCAC02_018788 [Chaenocephalus aceratus]